MNIMIINQIFKVFKKATEAHKDVIIVVEVFYQVQPCNGMPWCDKETYWRCFGRFYCVVFIQSLSF